MSPAVPVLVITGTMGSGKTTMLGEASDLLAARGIAHAAVDLDALGMGHLPEAAPDLPYRNLSSLWQNYAAAGAARVLIAEAVEHVGQLDRIRESVPGARIIVCRLTAPVAMMQRRVSQREPGMYRDAFVRRVAELEAMIDAARVEDFSLVSEEGRSITDVALEMLASANWISEPR